MASYLKASIKRSYAENFLAELDRNTNQYFFFVAKTTEWSNLNNPDVYTDTVRNEYATINNVIAYKKLNPKNTLFALPRYSWISGVVYAQYSDSAELFSISNPQVFYVVTDENNIYKCLYNNSNSLSTVKPTGVQASAFSTSDGYIWQYLATVRDSDLPYQLTDYIPINYATTSNDTETQNQYNAQLQAIPGALTRIEVANLQSSGVYNYCIPRSANYGTLYTLKPTLFTNTNGVKTVKINDPVSYGRIDTANLSKYIGYLMRVDYSTQNPSEINNYGIITGAVVDPAAPASSVIFTVSDDVIPFTVTPAVGDKVVSVEIIPLVKIYGDGTGAYGFAGVNSSKNVVSFRLVDGGKNYTKAAANIATPVAVGTYSPILTPVISPKGGHGSNILKELNVKDIILIVQLTDIDAEKFMGGGSYRQFGIIKNPVLSDGSGRIAGKDQPYYRDITLKYEGYDSNVSSSAFSTTRQETYVIGTESFTSSYVVSASGVSDLNGQKRITLKTKMSAGSYVSYIDRPQDYILNIDAVSRFTVGEKIKQIIPAGTNISAGISYNYDLVAEGTVLSYDPVNYTLNVRVNNNLFVLSGNNPIVGQIYGGSANVINIFPRYGEYVLAANNSVPYGGYLSFYTENGSPYVFKVVETSEPYFDETYNTAYSGLYGLNISTSVGSATGGIDTTYASLTPNSFSNGDFVEQGASGSYSQDYASGTVYYWNYSNASNGTLYLTDVLGKFKNVTDNGLTGSNLGGYIVASVTPPEIDKTSGEVLYIDNIRAITRTPAQKEEFRLRLGF